MPAARRSTDQLDIIMMRRPPFLAIAAVFVLPATAQADSTTAPILERLTWPQISLDRKRLERIDAFEVTVTCGSFHAITNIPYDWALQLEGPVSGVSTFRGQAGHGTAMLWTLRPLDGVIRYYRVADSCFNISAKVTVAAGDDTRTIVFSRDQLLPPK
jgi:hypothetical protein